MKRLGFALTSAVVFCLAVAAPALAGYGKPPGAETGTGGNDPAGTAFTGTNVSLGVAILAVLIVVGVSALLMSRRRAATVSSE